MSWGNIVDLSLPINPSMAGVEIDVAKRLEVDGWNASTLHLYSHSGTHMDAPYHFGVTDQRIDQIPVQRLISEAWVVDLPDTKPHALLTSRDFGDIAETFEVGQSLLLRTGWSKRIGDDLYRNALPRISRELALWMGEKGVNLLGVEPPSVADVNNLEEVTEIHQILMHHDVIILEGLCNLETLTAEKVKLIALPLKVEQGDGAPARVIAIEES